MAKGYRNGGMHSSPVQEHVIPDRDGVRRKIYVNTEGREIHLRSIHPMDIPDVVNSVEKPVKPTYTVELAGGGFEIHEHEYSISVDPETHENVVNTTLQTPADFAAWKTWEETTNEANNLVSERILATCLLDGVELEIEDIEEKEFLRWKRRRELKGLTVSEDPEELLLLYKQSALLSDAEDIKQIVRIVMELTGIDQEAIEKARSSFPGEMEPQS